MTTSQIFKTAHAAAKLADQLVAYRVRFVAALKAAWVAAKAPEVKEVDLRYRTATQAATYKQFTYILSFDNITTSRGLANYSQFSKKVNSWDASAIIDAAQAGKRLHLIY